MKVSIWKVVLGLVIIALLVGGSAMIYRAGYARGVMSDMSFEEMPSFADGGYAEMMPFGGHYGMRYGHGYRGYGHFSFGRMLFSGFLFFLIIGGFFRLFMGRRYGMSPWGMRGMRHYKGKGGPWMHHDHPCWDKYSEDKDEDDEEEAEA